MKGLKLQILDTPAGDQFNRQVESYDRDMKGQALRFPQLIEKVRALGVDPEYFERYNTYMRWGIRTLEYAFVLDNIVHQDGLRVLDVGSGVTIFPRPELLSYLGCQRRPLTHV